VNGVRPDPAFANIVEVTGDAGSRAHSINLGGNVIATNWHRTILFMNYSYTRAQANGGGAFSLPANGDDLASEWGPTQPRHRLQGQVNTEPLKDLSVSLQFRAQSASPYNITTGRDDNGDTVFNDRPSAVRRNSATGAGLWDMAARLTYAFGFGQRAPAGNGPGGQMVMIRMGGGAGDLLGGLPGGGAENKRVRLELFVAASNLLNTVNPIGYSGVMTSPFFGQATAAAAARKIDLGMKIGF